MSEQRQVSRFPVRFRSSFTSINVVGGEGRVLDLSVRGCRIETATEIHVGTILELRLYLSASEPPLAVSKAVVRWGKGKSVGVEFVSLAPEEWSRLRHYVKELERQSRPSSPAADS